MNDPGDKRLFAGVARLIKVGAEIDLVWELDSIPGERLRAGLELVGVLEPGLHDVIITLRALHDAAGSLQ